MSTRTTDETYFEKTFASLSKNSARNNGKRRMAIAKRLHGTQKKKKESSAIKEDSKISSLKSLKITSLKKNQNFIIIKITSLKKSNFYHL